MIDCESLFKLNYGMYIVGSKKGGKLNGCLINTVFQITPEPPMVAVSINKQCLTHEYITDSRVFSVSILRQETPMPFIGKFGFRTGRDIDKLAGVNYKAGITGSPIITDNAVSFVEAEVTDSVDVLSHTLFVAKIVACQIIDDREPLTYAYYRDIKHGKTPKSAATYVETEKKK